MYQRDLLRVAYVILVDASLAEDAAQAAGVKAWQKFEQVRDPHKVRAWLVAIAANEARRMARRRRTPQPAVPAQEYGAQADPRLADLSAVLSRLVPEDRRLLALRYVAELTSEEIGQSIGASAGAVRHRLMRLLARLREELE
jgi:RNA polymerase sigma-70 factor (ECF subfamily)